MKVIIKILAALLTISTLTSCPGGKDNPEDDTMGGSPSAATLVFPQNNTECTTGTVVNVSESTINFQWQTAANANSYEVNVRNLNFDEVKRITVNGNEAEVTLNQNTPYEWFVISMLDDSDQTATSDKWQFYNAGEGVENYAPFPALAVNPERGQTVSAASTINLEWSGNDLDSDITEFEIFFGTTNNPTASLGNTPQSSITANISSGQTYYWRVVTKDETGNTSQSEVFDFRVQ